MTVLFGTASWSPIIWIIATIVVGAMVFFLGAEDRKNIKKIPTRRRFSCVVKRYLGLKSRCLL